MQQTPHIVSEIRNLFIGSASINTEANISSSGQLLYALTTFIIQPPTDIVLLLKVVSVRNYVLITILCLSYYGTVNIAIEFSISNQSLIYINLCKLT